MVIKYLSIFLFWLAINIHSFGQCTAPVVGTTTEGCIGESLSFTIGAEDAVTWDFCSGELGEGPVFERIVENFRSFARSRAIDVSPGREGGYYLFSVNNAANELTILFFGDLLEDIPVVIQRVDISSYSPQAFDIDVIYHNDTYSVFVACSQTNTVTRLDFTGSLFDPPEATPLNLTFDRQVNAITIIQDQDNFVGFVSQNDQISRLNFGSDLFDPSPEFEHFNLDGLGTLRKSAFQKYCNNWIGLILSYEMQDPLVIKFEDGSLEGNITAEPLINNGDNLRAATNISFQWEGDTFYIHIMGAFGNFYSSQLEADKEINELNITDNGTLGVSTLNYPLKVVKDGPYWVAFSADHRERDLIRYRFPSPCDADQEIASGSAVQKSFSTSGAKTISIELSDPGVLQKTATTVVVNNNQAPPVSFSFSSSCVSSPVRFNFTEETSDITSIKWDFGDGSTGNGVEIEHSYRMPGSYLVTLEIESAGGCSNRSQQQVVVYDDFSAGFEVDGELFCTNSEIIFTNLIDEDLLEVTRHSWYINDIEVSNKTDLRYTFQEAGNYIIELVTQLGNCSSTLAKEIEVLEGAVPAFTVS
ncbi:MAG: PKD domain-containing protein, partial [Cyclobacteriaceae bacterium]